MTRGANPGNQRALTHGGHAQIAPVELREVADAITAALPVRHAADEWVVGELADALIRLSRFRKYADEHDPWAQRSKTGRVMARSVLYWESRYQDRVLRLMKELGMTPAARAKLGVDIARSVSLAEAMSEKDPHRRAELMRQAGVDLDDTIEGSSHDEQHS